MPICALSSRNTDIMTDKICVILWEKSVISFPTKLKMIEKGSESCSSMLKHLHGSLFRCQEKENSVLRY